MNQLRGMTINAQNLANLVVGKRGQDRYENIQTKLADDETFFRDMRSVCTRVHCETWLLASLVGGVVGITEDMINDHSLE